MSGNASLYMSLKKTVESLKIGEFIVEIFGLGYVGFPLAIRLAKSGLKIRGIDINSKRLKRLQTDNLYESELDLKDDFLKCKSDGRLEISESPKKTDLPKIGIICVPTPIPDEKTKSIVYVKSAVEDFLISSKKGDVIILESSVEVGTTEEIEKIIQSKGFVVGKDFGLCFCPERIDPANKEWGIENIPRIIYCSDDSSFKISKMIYQNVNGGNLISVDSPKIAEVVKSFENAFRLVNISLVNELAIFCDHLGISTRKVIEAASTKPFGFLPHYASAGAGGHCIPKDPRLLLESAKKFQFNFEMIENALQVNSTMPAYVSNSVEKTMNKMNLERIVLVCGLSYKANVEDMRDSASFKILTHLKSKGFKVMGYDPFFKIDFVEKYLTENNLREINFDVVNELDDNTIKNVNCLCVVQHHDIDKKRILEIYEKSLIPFIYDCQNKLQVIPSSKTILESLGS